MNEQVDQHHIEESGLENIPSESDDLDSSPPRYEIVTYPADYTLEGLVAKYKKGQIKIPGFQRKFVWTLPQASKLIESFLLGLPVPAVFLYTDPIDNSLLVIDGQQRLLSVAYYFEGYFGTEQRGRRTVFALKGLNESSPYLNKTYEQLRETNEPAANQLNDSVLRAFVIKQLNPGDSTSIYHIFERLNTGGSQLTSQEIRNCVYHGPFNELLCNLNTSDDWRAIYGNVVEDKRQRDVELILRFFALLHQANNYEKPMKDFLSKFMAFHRQAGREDVQSFGDTFRRTTVAIRSHLGDKPFHIRAGLNAAVFDAVFVAFGANLDHLHEGLKARYQKLIRDDEFTPLIQSGTTDKDSVHRRLDVAKDTLFSQ